MHNVVPEMRVHANDERNTSMEVPKGSSTDGGINIHVVKEDTIPPYANPVIFEQLHSPHILRLWRTGAAEFGYSPNEDEAFDVSYKYMVDFFHEACSLEPHW